MRNSFSLLNKVPYIGLIVIFILKSDLSFPDLHHVALLLRINTVIILLKVPF